MPVAIPVAKLVALVDPFSDPSPWGFKVITQKEIKRAIEREDYCLIHTALYSHTALSRIDHIRRVAYLTVNPAEDAVEIDVGVPTLGHHVDNPLVDGHHRLMAAIIRGDKTILASVSGDLGYAYKLFGVDCTER